jgi:hypothetical protein
LASIASSPHLWEFIIAAAMSYPTNFLWVAVAGRLLHHLGSIDSLIVGVIAPLLEQFRVKRFELLGRDSRHDFGAESTRRRHVMFGWINELNHKVKIS